MSYKLREEIDIL